MAVVEGIDGFILTKAQSTWLRGGGGRGDHGEATSGTAGAFLQWRARTAQRCLVGNGGRRWLSAVRGEMKNGLATRSGRRWLEVEDNGSGVRPATAHGRAIRDPATCVPHAAPVV